MSQDIYGFILLYNYVLTICIINLPLLMRYFFPVFPCQLLVETLCNTQYNKSTISTISTARDIHSCNLNCRNISTISTAGISTNSTRGLYPFVYSHHGTLCYHAYDNMLVFLWLLVGMLRNTYYNNC